MIRFLLISFCFCVLCANSLKAHTYSCSYYKVLNLIPAVACGVQDGLKNVKGCSLGLPAAHKNLAGKVTNVSIKDDNEVSLAAVFFVPIGIIVFSLLSVGTIGYMRYKKFYEREVEEKILIQKKSISDINALMDKEILMKMLGIEERNALVDRIKARLVKLKDKQPEAYQGWMSLAIMEVEKYKVIDLWKEFERDFIGLHPHFKKNLSSLYPDLTPNEYKVCALVRVNTKTRDISEVTGVSVKSIEAIRTKLRKKFELSSTDVLLGDFLSKFE